jgi:hypothetical protein
VREVGSRVEDLQSWVKLDEMASRQLIERFHEQPNGDIQVLRHPSVARWLAPD